MVIRFVEQVLIGLRVYGAGEVVSLPANDAHRLIAEGLAEEVERAPAPKPPPVREAVASAPSRARRAVKRGGADGAD